MHRQPDSHDDLQPVIEHLRAHRPELSALELDTVKQRVHGRVARQPGRARSATPMKSRLAILLTLVLGMMLSTTGAGLAISGFTGQQGNAAQGQYGDDDDDKRVGVLGEDDAGGGPAGDDDAGGGPAGDDEAGAPAGEEAVQPARQVEAGVQATGDDGEELPFTGFAAIPILLGGVALLAAGMALRRRTHDEP